MKLHKQRGNVRGSALMKQTLEFIKMQLDQVILMPDINKIVLEYAPFPNKIPIDMTRGPFLDAKNCWIGTQRCPQLHSQKYIDQINIVITVLRQNPSCIYKSRKNEFLFLLNNKFAFYRASANHHHECKFYHSLEHLRAQKTLLCLPSLVITTSPRAD